MICLDNRVVSGAASYREESLPEKREERHESEATAHHQKAHIYHAAHNINNKTTAVTTTRGGDGIKEEEEEEVEEKSGCNVFEKVNGLLVALCFGGCRVLGCIIAVVFMVEKTPQFLIGPAVRYIIFYLLVKSKSEDETKLEGYTQGNEYIYDGRLTRHREYGRDFSHLDNIIGTLLNRMPDHDV
eukprot:scaffold4612_cov155-Skeletonema_dohrnii-CCMP3373.AAC.3